MEEINDYIDVIPRFVYSVDYSLIISTVLRQFATERVKKWSKNVFVEYYKSSY